MELPKTCCMNVAKGDEPFRSCDKQATHWYLHDEDICSYCEGCNYNCGLPIKDGAVANRSDFIEKYKTQATWKAPIEEFIRRSPEFHGDGALASLIGAVIADLEFALKFPE